MKVCSRGYYSVESSANKQGLDLPTYLGKSLKIRKRIRPNIDSWGTPDFTKASIGMTQFVLIDNDHLTTI